jgi:hypothetical protein
LPTPLLAAGRQVILLETNTIVILVIGVATLVVGLVTLVIKPIEFGRK